MTIECVFVISVSQKKKKKVFTACEPMVQKVLKISHTYFYRSSVSYQALCVTYGGSVAVWHVV